MTLYLAAVSRTEASLIVVNKNGKSYKNLLDINLFERLARYANSMTDPFVPCVAELCIAEDGNIFVLIVRINIILEANF